MKECWYKNNTPNDLNLRDLGIRIEAWKTKNLFQLKPSLKQEQVLESEKEGLLAKCVRENKLIKLPFAPPPVNEFHTVPKVAEANQPIPSRVKTSIVMDMDEADFIEDLEGEFRSDSISAEKYADYADGIADPILLESDRDEMGTVVMPSDDEEDDEEIPIEAVDTETQQVGAGNNRYLVVNPAS